MVSFTTPKRSEARAANRGSHSVRPAIDLVESGGGLWKISSLPTINYCLGEGAQLRRLAGVSGGGLVVGLLAAGVTPTEMTAALPRVNKVNFLDAFQIPERLREVFPERVLTDNSVGRLPKRRDLRLGEIKKELSIVCARLDLSGSIIDVMRRVAIALKGLNFQAIMKAAAEVSSFL